MCILKIESLSLLSGIGTKISLSKCPGLKRAGSTRSARAIGGYDNEDIPQLLYSIHLRQKLSNHSLANSGLLFPDLTGASTSISSKKITHEGICFALLNTSLTARSLSPTHLLGSSGPFIPMNATTLSEATALALFQIYLELILASELTFWRIEIHFSSFPTMNSLFLKVCVGGGTLIGDPSLF